MDDHKQTICRHQTNKQARHMNLRLNPCNGRICMRWGRHLKQNAMGVRTGLLFVMANLP